MQTDSKKSVNIKRAKQFSMMYLIAFPLLTLVSCSLLFRGGVVFGLIVLVCAVVILAVGLKGLSDRSDRIVIDDEGITVKELGNVQIPWNEIGEARLESLPRGVSFVVLEIGGEDVQKVRFQVHGLSISPGQIRDLILSHTSN